MIASACLLATLLVGGPTGDSDPAPLTRAIDVLSLSAEQAATSIPVSVEGVVTVAQPDWGGRFFVQDGSAGIFVDNAGGPIPGPGDLVRVTGVSHPGGYAPVITAPTWEKLGTAPLPEAKPVSIERIMAGIEDSQRVEVPGTVRAVRIDEFAIVLAVVSGGYRFSAILPLAAAGEPASLVGAKVRLRGTAAAVFKPELRQVIRVNLFVSMADDLIVDKLDPHDPFLRDPIPIAKLAQYRPADAPDERVRIRGTVTYQRPGEDLFVTDATGGLHVRSTQPIIVKPGDVVEVVGFPGSEQFLPVLDDAVIRPTTEASRAVTPKPVGLQDLRESYHHADLVTLRGKVAELTMRATGHTDDGAPREIVTLTIQTPEFIFAAEGPATESNAPLAAIALESTVELTGICMLQVGDDGQFQSLQLLLPGVESVRVVREPSWLTPGRLLVGLAVLTGVLLLAIAWIVTMSRKNRTLKTVLREKVSAQEELQDAHDLLEERVEERTAQLKVEMNERKEAEVRFKATLAERTRLAQELHDTTEQSLTGIGLQLDTAAKLFEKNPDAARRPLETARILMNQSHRELRQSIWDLRSRELEQFDLPSAMELSAMDILRGTPVRLVFACSGSPRPLSEVVEENLLRIVREAINNVIKHADASRVELQLGFRPERVTLRVTDDGRGFDPATAPGSGDGHFGLLGMSERAKRLQGKLRLESTPGHGTRIEVTIPGVPFPQSETATAPSAPA